MKFELGKRDGWKGGEKEEVAGKRQGWPARDLDDYHKSNQAAKQSQITNKRHKQNKNKQKEIK